MKSLIHILQNPPKKEVWTEGSILTKEIDYDKWITQIHKAYIDNGWVKVGKKK